jgi:hypothetical protein
VQSVLLQHTTAKDAANNTMYPAINTHKLILQLWLCPCFPAGWLVVVKYNNLQEIACQ